MERKRRVKKGFVEMVDLGHRGVSCFSNPVMRGAAYGNAAWDH